MDDGTEPAWNAPAPGCWTIDRSHYPGGATPIADWLMSASMAAGLERVLAEIGAPIRTVDARFVNGFMYTRRRPLIRPDQSTTRLPPEPVLKVLSHLHPEMRKRAKQAQRTLDDPPQQAIVRDWTTRRRPQLIELNTALQSVDLGELSDDRLDAHVSQLLDHAMVAAELHFWLHGHDIGPIAQLLQVCEEWDIDPERAVDALAGASPSTSRPLMRLARLRGLIDAAGARPTSLDEVRAVSDEAAQLLDEHLTEHGSVLATGYDLTAATLGELPQVLLDSIMTAQYPATHDHEGVIAELASGLDGTRRAEFAELVDNARAVMDMRDDNGPLTVEWPAGLLRLALLHAGERLVSAGTWPQASLALEVSADEARHLVTSGGAPGANELERRRARRELWAALEPPVQLGPTEPEPSPDVLPRPLPEVVRIVQASFRHLGMDGAERADGLSGVGVGSGQLTARARVVASADEAMDALEPGDVLVVRATSPAFNVVLAIAGAVVTADGGAMSHAAVLARELGIPAVIGAQDALTIPDGATITVDADAGTVRVSE